MTVSHHYLRRRARKVAGDWNRLARERQLPWRYVVEPAERGPYRWRVERVAA